jgi:hypothetical protein
VRLDLPVLQVRLEPSDLLVQLDLQALRVQLVLPARKDLRGRQAV